MHKFSLKSALLTALLLLVCSVSALALNEAEVKVGSIAGDSVNLRANPSLSAKVLRKGYDDEFIVVLEKANDEWYKVNYKGTTGFMFAQYVSIIDEADFDAIPGQITGNSVNVRAEPSLTADKYGQINKGDAITVTGVANGWFKVSYNEQTGYIHPDFMQLDVKTDAVPESVQDAAPVMAVVDANQELGAQIIEYAKQFLGTPYRYGSMSGKSFDCSGFTSYVFKHFGISLNRSAAGQLSNGAVVDKANLQVGDLVLFSDKSINKAAASHVGIYVGNGQFIHASSRRGGVIYSNLSDSYYNRVYKSARRVI